MISDNHTRELKYLEKQEQSKPKPNLHQEILKLRAEIHEMKRDIDVLKTVVMKHSELLEKIS